MKAYRPCNQPMGERDTDDLVFDSASSYLQSFDTSPRGGYQAPQKGQQLYTTVQSDAHGMFKPSEDSLQKHLSYDSNKP